LLKASEERELAALVREGDKAAYDRMVESNLRLVVSIAKYYANRGLDLPDLVQEGNLGLMHAVTKYDGRKGYRFSTYATWWIKQAIRRAIVNKTRTIRIPAYLIEIIGRARRTRPRLSVELGRDPTDLEVAQALGMIEPKRLSVFRRAMKADSESVGSLDTFVDIHEDSQDSGREAIVEDASRKETLKNLQAALKVLSSRERLILSKRFGLVGEEEETLREIGAEIGLTRERVRQIQEEALNKLSRALGGPLRPQRAVRRIVSKKRVSEDGQGKKGS
jgi:RNA polymerase primary sigma factor